jgi:Cu-processing system ATP-binding protein
MVSVNNLHKKFNKNEVLKGVELNIEEGKTTAILGPNGSGKTTLVKIILGMVLPNQGDVIFNNQNIKNSWTYRKEIDYLPQIANFPANIKVQELINMIKDLRNKPARDQELIEYFNLGNYLNESLGNLSGGYKQKVNLLLTFMFDSPFIILDEPTSGLDPISLIRLKDFIKQEQAKGKTIIVTSHVMNFVEEVANHVIFILDGKVYFEGSLNSLKEQYKNVDLEHAIANILKENNV